MSNWIPTVNTITDNIDPVSEASINPIIASLVGRDQYLFERIDSYGDKAALLAYNVPVAAGSGVAINHTVYYKANTGIKKALTGYQSSADPAHLVPGEEAFVFGIVKTTYTVDTLLRADVYLRGLIDVTITNLIDSSSTASGKTVGPLYLSSLEAGKLTYFPGGASVFVGYAVSTTQLFLAPNIDSLNQLYFNYRFYLRDIPAGTPVNSSGTWTVGSPSYTSTGWINAADAGTHYGYPVPTGAKFFYNVPTAANITADGSMTAAEKKDALLYKDAIPPYPAAYSMVFLNGVLQHAYDTDHTGGVYIIDNRGVWWCNDSTTYKPWYTTPNPRVTIVLQTTKLNPHYKSSVVTSLKAYNDVTNDSTGAISLVDGSSSQPSSSGDLLIKFKLPTQAVTQSPVGSTFVKDIGYDEPTGKLVIQTSPGIVDVVQGPGVSVSKSNGVATVGLSNFSLSGVVTDIEPEDSEFVYKGLHSYLRIKNPTGTQKIGFVGKLALPNVLPANLPLHIKLLMFGETTSTSYPVKFKFEYSVSKPGVITDAVYKANSGADIDVVNFTANIAQLVQSTGSTYYFEVPASSLTANAFLNFRVARVNSTYSANVGVIAVQWAIE